jgi:hypothetical protein
MNEFKDDEFTDEELEEDRITEYYECPYEFHCGADCEYFSNNACDIAKDMFFPVK